MARRRTPLAVTVPAGDRASPTRPGGSVWFTRRAVCAHLALAVWVPGCAVAAWWQVGIALGGDALGWVYSVMWPCFAVFGLVFWWFLVHDDPDRLGARGLRRNLGATANGVGAMPGVTGQSELIDASTEEALRIADAEADDPELARYNAYLAALADREKTWRPGRN
jgi:hypothetical protein